MVEEAKLTVLLLLSLALLCTAAGRMIGCAHVATPTTVHWRKQGPPRTSPYVQTSDRPSIVSPHPWGESPTCLIQTSCLILSLQQVAQSLTAAEQPPRSLLYQTAETGHQDPYARPPRPTHRRVSLPCRAVLAGRPAAWRQPVPARAKL
jgi:hypothetical protein